MSVVRWILPLLSFAIVLFVTWWDFGGEGAGPGPLHPAHARVPELSGGSNCDACHEVGAGIGAALCNSCHGAIDEQLAAETGLHGTLPPDQARRCESCHGEHHGDTVQLIAEHSFQRAGIDDVDAYDHGHVEFALTGAHDALACERCHPHSNAVEPPADGRYLGASQRCTSCHDDSHRGAFGTDCASCHGQDEEWKAVPLFPHAGFPLADAHAKVACLECHAENGEHSTTALLAQPQPTRVCAVCHESPHGDPGAPARALRLHGAGDCKRCHLPTTWDAARTSPEQHATLGFPLRGAHATATCADCHGDARTMPRWNGEAPKLQACGLCHEHPHDAGLLAAATAARGPASGCGGCHEDADPDFLGGRMPTALHAATGFLLELPHADVACAKCHTGFTKEERFPGRSAADCRTCHLDVHRGQFDNGLRHGQCTDCHLKTSFDPPQFGIEAHAATRFPLRGAHDAVACNGCHRIVADGVRRFGGTPSVCRECHADIHEGKFDQRGHPKTVAGKTGCARCHDARAFAPLAGAFDHTLWTGYELLGAHAAAACTACHPRGGATAQGGARRLGSTAGSRCGDCHTDPHAGQFAVRGVTDCRRCHGTDSFHGTRFDHRQSRFQLDEVHRAVACAKCHRSYPSRRGEIVRYKPLGVTCGDCHKLGQAHGGGR